MDVDLSSSHIPPPLPPPVRWMRSQRCFVTARFAARTKGPVVEDQDLDPKDSQTIRQRHRAASEAVLPGLSRLEEQLVGVGVAVRGEKGGRCVCRVRSVTCRKDGLGGTGSLGGRRDAEGGEVLDVARNRWGRKLNSADVFFGSREEGRKR